MNNIKAYGAGLAGGQFDKNMFFKKPTVIFKCGGLIFGVILWYCISKGGWHRVSGSTHHQICLYGNSPSTCSFASALGFFAVVGAVTLLVSDARFDNISSVPTRKRVILADLVVSVCFFVIFVIGFFTFWSKLSDLETDEPVKTGYVKFGILMTLFSLIAWAGAAFFSWRRHEEGAADAFADNFDDHFGGVSSEVQDGYGYGGSSEGIGSIGVGNASYQAGGPPAANIPPQQPQQPPTNPYVNSEGYGY